MSKQPAPRRPKPGVRSHLPTGDLIALGPKTQGTRNPDSDLKPIQPPKSIPAPLPKKPISLGSSERKRESPNPALTIPKRPKVPSPPQYSPHRTIGGEGERRQSGGSTQYFSSHVSPIEANPSDLERLVLEAEASEDRTKVDGLLLGAIKTLKTNKTRPDPAVYLSLLYLAKTKPECFASNRVIEALTSLLKRDSIINIKTNKGLASLVPIMTVNILLYIFQDTENWPETFVKVYVEDSLADRIWVDNEACQLFVDNILTAFGTKRHPKSISRQSSDPGSKNEQPPTLPVTAATTSTIFMPSTSKEDEDTFTEEIDLSSNEEDATLVIPRFTSPSVKYNVSTYLLEIVTEQLNRRQPVDNISRNLLRLLVATCGNNQVRLLVSQRIEVWLQNPKLTRPAQELLTSLCLNCDSHTHEDVEVISNLIKMRLKTKLISNHYVSSIKELLSQHTENLSTVMKYVIYNELSNARNPNNMNLLATMFQYKPEASSKILAMVFQDLLMNKEDYLRACRALLREIVRFLRYGPLNFVVLCRGFMQERTDSQFKDLDGSTKERMLMSLTDLIAMATMLSITPAVKERYADFKRGDMKGLSVLQDFQKNVSTIQRDGVWWLHTIVPKMFNPNGQDFHSCLQKILYLEPVDNYSTKDGWPQECDRSLFYSLSSEVPLQEDTLMRIIIIGLATELPLSAPEALDVADRTVRRAAAVKTGVQPLKVTRQELLDAMLNLCEYHHPKDIQLPSGYVPPKLAISNLYWKAWMLLTIVASLNPDSIGQSGWDNFPMLKSLMEMIMTNNCVFPPPTIASTNEEKEQIIADDMQLVQIEKEDILQFESHLAAATTGVNITESNSLLLSQLITMDPVGPARRPPQSFMEELKTTNSLLKLGQKLCRSREPDFLLDIIQRQGTSQSMPWLAELVQSSEGSLDVLPVQCLCEFLLMEQQSSEKINEEISKRKMSNQKHVLLRLRCLLSGSSADGDATVEVLEYFMRRLSSGLTKERNAAIKGLELVLSQESSMNNEDDSSVVSFSDDVSLMNAIEEMSFQENNAMPTTLSHEFKWLLVHLPRLPHFEIVKSICCFELRQCCQVEIEPQRLQAYLVFLSQNSGEPVEEDFTETLLEISQLVIARPTIFNQVLEGTNEGQETFQALLGMYACAVQYAMTVQDNSYFESNSQDQLFAQWSKDTKYPGKAAAIHALDIQASILLLTWPEPTDNPLTYRTLLDCWCPERGHVRVYLTDTGEEAILLPEWLRLRMIRAASHRVVDAAMIDLVPSQLVLFAQSFGIPVYSMSKLLHELDLAAEEDSLSVNEAVLDKAYMVQLVEVQQQRGAEGGDLFCSLLSDEPLHRNPAVEETLHKPLVIKPHLPRRNEPMKSLEDNMEDMILKCLELKGTEASEARQIESKIKRLLTNDLISLNKDQNSDCSWSENMISSLITVFTIHPSPPLTCNKKSNFLCAILTLLRARQSVLPATSKLSESFPELLKTLSSRCLEDGVFKKTLQQYTKQFNLPAEKQKYVDASQSLKDISQEKFDDESIVRSFILQAKQLPLECTIDMETVAKACMNIKSKSPHLLEEFCKAVLSVIIHRIGQATETPWSSSQSLPLQTYIQTLTALLQDNNQPLSRGLFVDWLETLDPEIVDVHPLIQRQILFSDRPCVDSQDRSLTSNSGNSYLLALLAHNSKYSTLQDCLDWLLGQQTSRLLPGAALDFLWACYHLPRLWQGREQRSTAHTVDNEDCVLTLTQAQACQVALLVLAEIEEGVRQLCINKSIDWEDVCHKTTLPDGELRVQINQAILHVTQQRIPVMLQCCYGQDVKLIINYINNNTRYPKWLRAPFIIHLYLAHPHIYTGLDKQGFFVSNVFTEATECQMDSLCHCALTVLADCRPGHEYEDSANTSSLLCRKIASTHPMLFLRHLPMINCLLRGRVHLTSKEFNINQHLLVFSHVLGILDLLRPYVFSNDKFIEDGLEEMLTIYFDLIQSSCLSSKELAGVVSKFAEFFYHFCTSKPAKSFPILQANASLLHDLLSSFPELSSLKCLASALSVPSAAPGTKGSFHSLIMPLEASSWTPAQLAPVIQQLSPSEPLPEILRALTDLDETSKRRVDILQHFLAELNRLTSSSDSNVRTKAHTLIQRHLRQNPRDAQKFVDCFMECLSCTSPDVTLTAAKFTPEFLLLGCEYSTLLLQKLFSVAVSERIDVVSSLARSIQLLNLEFSK